MAENTVPTSLHRLRISASVTAVLVLVQLALGVTLATRIGGHAISEIHGGVGYLSLLASAVTAVFAWQAAKLVGSKGIFFHAVSLPVLMIVQIGLAEMRAVVVHIILGVLIVAGVAALVPMVNKQVTKVAA
ncbi:hypothetical protein [Raineyella fluvialis]|uniref:Uncharacterized protein n=1 Tax=Raineyella fluvialis TaxID=2662261 RepID=A0A5Q2FCS6_9ACTN|nr:hypothetical protein [Raineyella fluvialis]QGF22893.1 hypothetical protein Rai3103_03550 [Raineyella fluvialis]